MSRSVVWLTSVSMFVVTGANAQAPSRSADEISRQAQEAEAAAPPELSTRNDDLVAVTLPDGTQMVDLKGRFEMRTSIVRMPDGSFKTVCADAHAEALHNHQTRNETTTAVEDASR